MRVHVVGCSPAWPNPGGAQSGYLVEENGRRLLLDCGPGVLPRLRRLEGWPRIDAIVITHFHLDHWGDLVPWAFGGLFGAGREVPAPELPTGDRVAHLLLALRTDETGFATVANLAFCGARWRLERRLKAPVLDALAPAVAAARRMR